MASRKCKLTPGAHIRFVSDSAVLDTLQGVAYTPMYTEKVTNIFCRASSCQSCVGAVIPQSTHGYIHLQMRKLRLTEVKQLAKAAAPRAGAGSVTPALSFIPWYTP